VIIRATLVQLRTPDEMPRAGDGRRHGFSSAHRMNWRQFESGLTAQWFGAVPAVILGGVGTLVVICALGLDIPRFAAHRRSPHFKSARQKPIQKRVKD